MPTSKRQALVSAMETRLKTILISGGYETDLGLNVRIWRQEPFTDTEKGISIEDAEESPTWIGAGVQLHRLTFQVKIVLPATASQTEIRSAVADISKVVGTDLTFGGLAEDCVLTEVALYVGQEGSLHAGAVVTVVMEYATEPWSPY